MGGLGGGHYTAFCKNFLNKQWFEFNDDRVSPVNDIAELQSADAYLLFYQRKK